MSSSHRPVPKLKARQRRKSALSIVTKAPNVVMPEQPPTRTNTQQTVSKLMEAETRNCRQRGGEIKRLATLHRDVPGKDGRRTALSVRTASAWRGQRAEGRKRISSVSSPVKGAGSCSRSCLGSALDRCGSLRFLRISAGHRGMQQIFWRSAASWPSSRVLPCSRSTPLRRMSHRDDSTTGILLQPAQSIQAAHARRRALGRKQFHNHIISQASSWRLPVGCRRSKSSQTLLKMASMAPRLQQGVDFGDRGWLCQQQTSFTCEPRAKQKVSQINLQCKPLSFLFTSQTVRMSCRLPGAEASARESSESLSSRRKCWLHNAASPLLTRLFRQMLETIPTQVVILVALIPPIAELLVRS